MLDNIPFDIFIEIMIKVSCVKSLIQFRSVSKQWKSFIDSSDFINGYGARHTHPHSHILTYRSDYAKPYEWHHSSSWWSQEELRYICLVDDDDAQTFKVQEQDVAPFVISPLLKQYPITYVVGACHGLLCLYGYNEDKLHTCTLVIWNPSIGKSFGIALPRFDSEVCYGFGVCPVTRDPTVVKLVCSSRRPWHVEVFRLSSGVWNVIPSGSLPRQTVKVIRESTHVAIDKFIYWGAWEMTNADHGKSTFNHMVVSFDLVTEEFKLINLRDTLTNKLFKHLSLSKLRGSLIVCGYSVSGEAGVWVMENDSCFRKLFTVGAPVYFNLDKILGFKKNGEIIYKTPKNPRRITAVLNVYDRCSQQIKDIGISGQNSSFFMDSYKESLLLLDHMDSHIYSDNN